METDTFFQLGVNLSKGLRDDDKDIAHVLGNTDNSTTNQYFQILDWLKSSRTLTPLQALDKFGCLRLGARIYDMKQNGIDVKTEMIKVGKNKRVARYSI